MDIEKVRYREVAILERHAKALESLKSKTGKCRNMLLRIAIEDLLKKYGVNDT